MKHRLHTKLEFGSCRPRWVCSSLTKTAPIVLNALNFTLLFLLHTHISVYLADFPLILFSLRTRSICPSPSPSHRIPGSDVHSCRQGGVWVQHLHRRPQVLHEDEGVIISLHHPLELIHHLVRPLEP